MIEMYFWKGNWGHWNKGNYSYNCKEIERKFCDWNNSSRSEGRESREYCVCLYASLVWRGENVLRESVKWQLINKFLISRQRQPLFSIQFSLTLAKSRPFCPLFVVITRCFCLLQLSAAFLSLFQGIITLFFIILFFSHSIFTVIKIYNLVMIIMIETPRNITFIDFPLTYSIMVTV